MILKCPQLCNSYPGISRGQEAGRGQAQGVYTLGPGQLGPGLVKHKLTGTTRAGWKEGE